MSLQYQFRPIITWPGKLTRDRQRAPFGVGFNRTLKDLERELAHLGASTAIVQAAIKESDLRRDGMLYADTRLAHPGIILTFVGKHGPIQMPCDTYIEWTHNLRAITLALDALRRVDRYGVTKLGEQYTGWKQLPGAVITPPPMTVEEAARFIAERSSVSLGVIMQSDSWFKTAYRQAALRLHPDTHGSGQTHPEWQRLQDAAAVLKQYLGANA